MTSYVYKIVVRNQTSGDQPSGLPARRGVCTGMGTAGNPRRGFLGKSAGMGTVVAGNISYDKNLVQGS